MKIVTASNGKRTVKMSKAEWQSIGEKAGWMKTASTKKVAQWQDKPLMQDEALAKNLSDQLKALTETSYKLTSIKNENDLDAVGFNFTKAMANLNSAYQTFLHKKKTELSNNGAAQKGTATQNKPTTQMSPTPAPTPA